MRPLQPHFLPRVMLSSLSSWLEWVEYKERIWAMEFCMIAWLWFPLKEPAPFCWAAIAAVEKQQLRITSRAISGSLNVAKLRWNGTLLVGLFQGFMTILPFGLAFPGADDEGGVAGSVIRCLLLGLVRQVSSREELLWFVLQRKVCPFRTAFSMLYVSGGLGTLRELRNDLKFGRFFALFRWMTMRRPKRWNAVRLRLENCIECC